MIEHRYNGTTRTGQVWQRGQVVSVGFLRGLTVVGAMPTPKDFAPDKYFLKDSSGREYEFVPHRGISRGWDAKDARAAGLGEV